MCTIYACYAISLHTALSSMVPNHSLLLPHFRYCLKASYLSKLHHSSLSLRCMLDWVWAAFPRAGQLVIHRWVLTLNMLHSKGITKIRKVYPTRYLQIQIPRWFDEHVTPTIIKEIKLYCKSVSAIWLARYRCPRWHKSVLDYRCLGSCHHNNFYPVDRVPYIITRNGDVY